MNCIFDVIRTRSEQVACKSRWVHIDERALGQCADRLDLLSTYEMSHSAEHHLLHRGDDTLAYFLILDTINFGSGYFPYIDKESGASGYFTVAKCLKSWMESDGVPSAKQLESLTPEDLHGIFHQRSDNLHANELMELFARALTQLGAWLSLEFQGDYGAVFANADSAEDVVESLLKMQFFRDVARYGDFEVPFLKRAQILVQDVALADPGNETLMYPDLEKLTVFADNLLPYVFKAEGVFVYEPWLAERIERGELIAPSSVEEVELRACTVHAAELLRKTVSHVRPITSRELDFRLWQRGQTLKKQIPDLRHRTRCMFY